MPNLLQDNVEKTEDDVTANEKLTASCENLEPSTITLVEHESKVMPMMLNSQKVEFS